METINFDDMMTVAQEHYPDRDAGGWGRTGRVTGIDTQGRMVWRGTGKELHVPLTALTPHPGGGTRMGRVLVKVPVVSVSHSDPSTISLHIGTGATDSILHTQLPLGLKDAMVNRWVNENRQDRSPVVA
ncbi:MAG: hypothetical protein IPP14_15775 [Planctomycetes bacterium]|nr:hypothetical protein [Planctomycetota bacterium]